MSRKEIKPVECRNVRVLTTQQLAEEYGTDSKVISKNFERNKERYTEGKHFICLTGEELKEFKANRQNDDTLKFTSILYLWTKKGAFLHAKSLNTDKAWEVYDYLVDSYFEKQEEKVNLENLSPELQMFKMIFDQQARVELEQKRQAEELKSVKTVVKNMKDELLNPIGNWRAEINDKVREVAIKSGIDFQELYTQMYAELETTAHCSLSSLQRNKRDRMEKAGNTKQAIKNETCKIAIIESRPQLKAIFESIVRRYAMAYC